MQAEANKILTNVTPNTIAIFWFTKNELSEDLPNFQQFNYLFNSLISDYIKENKSTEKKKSHNFHTKNFNSKLWLIHLSGTGLSNEIKESMTLLKSDSIEKFEILVLNDTEKKWEDELPKFYTDFVFKKFN